MSIKLTYYLFYHIMLPASVYRKPAQLSEKKAEWWFEQFFFTQELTVIEFQLTSKCQSDYKIPAAGMRTNNKNAFFQVIRERPLDRPAPDTQKKGPK